MGLTVGDPFFGDDASISDWSLGSQYYEVLLELLLGAADQIFSRTASVDSLIDSDDGASEGFDWVTCPAVIAVAFVEALACFHRFAVLLALCTGFAAVTMAVNLIALGYVATFASRALIQHSSECISFHLCRLMQRYRHTMSHL
jgi:hypothetical protein